MSANEDLEKRAAAVANALKARAKRRDLGGVRIRDYDLLFSDGSFLKYDRAIEQLRLADSRRLV